MPGERCPRCGKPRWLGPGAYYRWNHLCGSIFIPPAPGELCECDRDDDKALRRRLEDALSANESLRNQLPTGSEGKAEAQLIAHPYARADRAVHRQYDSRQIGQDEFEARKAALLAQLRID